MTKTIDEILLQEEFSRDDLIALIDSDDEGKKKLFQKAHEVKQQFIGNKVYFRGLVEFSNICSKDCYYCGIRKSNKNAHRYNITDEDILEAARFAHENKYGSMVIQGGELDSPVFVDRIDHLLKEIKKLSNGELGITLSLGEQTEKTYQRWFDSGAHRYLLRIESSTPELYYKIHPNNPKHDFDTRLECLYKLQRVGYQTGTGVMIGLPFQTSEHLADDLLFFKKLSVDMVGMGPYIEHENTPLYQHRHLLIPLQDRFTLALKMIAILRIMMKDINIAAATALQAIDPIGREKALKVGANIIMPNITPTDFRGDYLLYENKPCIDEGADECSNCLEARIKFAGDEIGYGHWGDSKHFFERRKQVSVGSQQ
ncbi:MAG: [FeFe] hydrogenase H-cluster radical SAM maturase HydE [Bacteroidales bacterium]|nr:[FeFe] hydrogenase H-cluster radical SAM maturase HydE [Bacteroidales bacterium]MCF8456323.1 [FeFe] hydrogenase H-cluster radical SAM maturase HydE [Bacteroidales bacterium]